MLALYVRAREVERKREEAALSLFLARARERHNSAAAAMPRSFFAIDDDRRANGGRRIACDVPQTCTPSRTNPGRGSKEDAEDERIDRDDFGAERD